MDNFPAEALPQGPATDDPTLASIPDPLALPASHLEHFDLVGSDEGYAPPEFTSGVAEERTLDCDDLDDQGLWQTDDCCALCHSYTPIAPAPLHHRHITVRGCCASHDALNHLNPPRDDFMARLFG